MKNEIDIFVEEKSIKRSEFYESLRSGVSVKTVLEARIEDFELSLHEENDKRMYARKIKYDGETYDIIRTYKQGKSKIEIICG